MLKGGVLLAAFDARRPTRDVDLAAVDLASDVDDIRTLVNEACHTPDRPARCHLT